MKKTIFLLIGIINFLFLSISNSQELADDIPRIQDWEIYDLNEFGIPVDAAITSIISDSSKVWIGTDNSGLYLFDGNQLTNFNTNNSILEVNEVRVIGIDNSNVIWLEQGTSSASVSGLLVSINNNNFTIHSPIQDTSLDFKVRSNIEVDSNGNVWFLFFEDINNDFYLVKYDGQSWEYFNHSNSDLPDFTYGNYYSTLGSSSPFYGKINGNALASIEENLFLSSKNGLVKFSTNDYSVQVFNENNSNILYDGLSSIYENSSGELWIGSDPLINKVYPQVETGLSKLDNNIFTHFTTTNSSISGNAIQLVGVDKYDRIYFNSENWTLNDESSANGTNEGFIQFDGQNFKNLTSTLGVTYFSSDDTGLFVLRDNYLYVYYFGENNNGNNYCYPLISTFHAYLGRFQLGEIDNSSKAGLEGYENFTEISTDLVQGTDVQFTTSLVRNSTSSISFNYYIWIDYNDDGDFDDDGELLATLLNNPNEINTSSFTIKQDALGKKRLRIVATTSSIINPCAEESFDFGEVEDYTINIISEVETTNIPDSNFENYLETHDANGNVVEVGSPNSMGDGISDNQLVFTSRIDNVIILNVDGAGKPFEDKISDLTGIEDFVSLEELICWNNPLSSIDVTKNINLIELMVGYGLNHLDVTQNTKLELLYCGFNQLTNLDISNNPSLKLLACDNNLLSSIDLSNNPLLHYLRVDNNQFSSIDLSNLNNLTYLNCSKNQLSSLDIGNNLGLTSLFCSNNLLTNIDISQHSQIFRINCSYNKLKSLNLKNGNNYNFLTVNYDIFDLRNNPELTCVQVDDATYSSANWDAIDPQAIFSENCNLGTNYIIVENNKAFVGETNSVNAILENTEIIKGFQFDITFPSGFIFDPNDIMNVDLPENYQISCASVGGNVYRVVGFSLSNETIASGTTTILTFPTFVEEGTLEGEYPIPITNVTLSDVNNTDISMPSPSDGIITVYSHPLGDANGDDTVNILDILDTIDYIFGNPSPSFIFGLSDVNSDGVINILDVLGIQDIILSPSSKIIPNHNKSNIAPNLNTENYLTVNNAEFSTDSSETIEIDLNNDDVVKGLEFDFTLPEGFTFDPMDISATTRLNGFTISAQEISQNTYKVLVFSLSSATVSSGTGVILNLPVFVESSVSNGTYPISFDNVIISDTNNTNVSTTAPSVGEITINSLGTSNSFKMENRWLLYPNPTDSKLNVKGNLSELESLDVIDLTGKQIFSIKEGFKEIDISSLPSSLYFVKVTSKDFDVKTFKIIKE